MILIVGLKLEVIIIYFLNTAEMQLRRSAGA